MRKVENVKMRKLGNERINRLENGVNANNANNTRKTRNANNTTKGNRQVELFGRVGQVREGVGGFGRKRRNSKEG